MIRDITITSKGDYQRITFSREEDSHTIDMSFSYPYGCCYASFNLEDMKNEVTYQPFIRIIESLQTSVEKVPIREAFEELDADKDYYKLLPPDFFDLIVVDECHRGSLNEEKSLTVWMKVSELESKVKSAFPDFDAWLRTVDEDPYGIDQNGNPRNPEKMSIFVMIHTSVHMVKESAIWQAFNYFITNNIFF